MVSVPVSSNRGGTVGKFYARPSTRPYGVGGASAVRQGSESGSAAHRSTCATVAQQAGNRHAGRGWEWHERGQERGSANLSFARAPRLELLPPMVAPRSTPDASRGRTPHNLTVALIGDRCAIAEALRSCCSSLAEWVRFKAEYSIFGCVYEMCE